MDGCPVVTRPGRESESESKSENENEREPWQSDRSTQEYALTGRGVRKLGDLIRGRLAAAAYCFVPSWVIASVEESATLQYSVLTAFTHGWWAVAVNSHYDDSTNP